MARNHKKEYEIHLEEVFKRLQQHGLVLHLEKCIFCASSVEFLGQHVSMQGLRPLGTHVAAIKAPPAPASKSQLMSFLGMLNFYWRYLRGAASILKPLTDATRGAGGTAQPAEVDQGDGEGICGRQGSPHGRHPPGPPHPGGRALPGS